MEPVPDPASGIILAALWLCWYAFWLISAFDVKATRRKESAGARALHLVPIIIGAVLLASRRIPIPWLNTEMLPATVAVHSLGIAIVAAALGFTVWARLHLGRNWSGPVSLKQDHELVRSGPYRYVRHPIYAGVLVALLGSAIVIGEWRALLGVMAIGVAVMRKVSVEERWLGEVFPDEYARYRREVPALIPSIGVCWPYRGGHDER